MLLIYQIMSRCWHQAADIWLARLHRRGHHPAFRRWDLDFLPCLFVDEEVPCGQDLDGSDRLDVRVIVMHVDFACDLLLHYFHRVFSDDFLGHGGTDNFFNIRVGAGPQSEAWREMKTFAWLSVRGRGAHDLALLSVHLDWGGNVV